MVALLAPLCILAVALASPLHIIYSSFAPSSPQSLRIHAIAAANQTGKATAEPFFTNGKDWRTTATIGGQELRLWLDTGSSDLWVYGSTIPANDTEGHMLFDPSQSPTFQNVSDSSWAVAYVGNMGASGYWGTDTVTVGGVTVQGQTVEVANRIFGVRENFNGADGILGLGFNGSQGASGGSHPTFTDAAISTLAQPLFTFDLYNSTTGTFELGYIDDTLYTGSLTTVQADPKLNNWFVPGISFSVEGQNLSTAGLYEMSFDTGGEVLSFGRDLAAAYWTHVPGAVMFQPADALGVRWYYPCTESQPAVTLHFTSVSASGSGSGSGNATAVIRSEVLDQLRYDLGNGTCVGSVWGFGPFVGAPFFLDYFAVFEPLEPRMSFAPKANPGV